MNAKKLLVSLFAIFAVSVFLVSGVAAAEVADDVVIWVNGVPTVYQGTGIVTFDDPAIFAGETFPIRVSFTGAQNAEDVRVEVEIDGYADGLEARTDRFDVIQGVQYTKTLSITVPFDLEDELYDGFEVTVKIYDQHDETEVSFDVVVQRESYSLDVLSIDTVGIANAGEVLPVEVVLKNRGMRDLEDLFVTARIPGLGVEKRMYFSDVFATDECIESVADVDKDDDRDHCDEDDSLFGRINLMVPSNAAPGVYTLEVTARNDEVVASATKQIAVDNRIPVDGVLPVTSARTFGVGEQGTYEVLIINPTNELKVYRAIAETASGLTVSVDPSLIAVPAGSSKSVIVSAVAEEEGRYNFGVSIYADSGELVDKVALSASVDGESRNVDNTVIALTVILAIIFVVLLIVLISLLGRKPEKTEEFGESYY
jgi:uncharacterized membrane protein